MTENEGFILGHDPIGFRPNIRAELTRVRQDPLRELLEVIGGLNDIFSNPRTRYQEAYWFYFLSLERCLHEMSVAARYSRGPEWVRRSGGAKRFTASQRKLAKRYNELAPFLAYDLVNCLIHSRILLDRVAGIAQSFLTGQRLPSFTSFRKHKQFFTHLAEPYGIHEDYAEYVRERTDWFEMPLLELRDKFVVHAAQRHMRYLGYDSEDELGLFIIVPDEVERLGRVKHISFYALRLSYDMEQFLKWFGQYGLNALNASTKPLPKQS
jgi:hypothetical protein